MTAHDLICNVIADLSQALANLSGSLLKAVCVIVQLVNEFIQAPNVYSEIHDTFTFRTAIDTEFRDFAMRRTV